MTTASKPEVGTAVAPREERPATLALIRPVASPGALIEAHKELAQIVQEALESGTDFGVIPGTGSKPTLLKPGAERLSAAFGLRPEFEVVTEEVDHFREVAWTKRKKVWANRFRGDKTFKWDEERGTSTGFYRYVVRCRLIRRDTGEEMGQGIGTCSTLESKYVDRPRDSENTALKMAKKRAHVDATLTTLGLSDRFTQDVEDLHGAEPEPGRDAAVAPAAPPTTPAETGEAATEKQERFLGKLLKSSVWTQEERVAYAKRGGEATKQQMTALIDEVVEEGKRRKAAERKPTEKPPAETPAEAMQRPLHEPPPPLTVPDDSDLPF